MTEELSKDLQNDLTRQFEAGLAKVKYEYQKNLQEMDPLDEEALEKMLTVFNQRLVIFQHEFMEYLSKVRAGSRGVNPYTEEFVIEAPPIERIPAIAAGAAGGIAAGPVGVVVAIGMRIRMRRAQRKLIRKALIDKFDEDTAPKLRAWVHDKIQNRGPK